MAAKGQLASIVMQALVAKGQLALIEVTTIDPVIAQWPDVVESGDLVTLDVTVTNGVVEYEQTAGPTTALTSVGSDRTFVAPATLDGTVLGYRVRTTVGSVSSEWVDMEVAVRAHPWWVKASGTLVPVSFKIKTTSGLV